MTEQPSHDSSPEEPTDTVETVEQEQRWTDYSQLEETDA
jgi:hypothetical protein